MAVAVLMAVLAAAVLDGVGSGGGHRPAIRWYPDEPPRFFHLRKPEAFAVAPLKAFLIDPTMEVKDQAAVASETVALEALSGARRSPLSYHEETGFVGGFQPGGGTHSSVGGGGVQRPAPR